MASKVEAYVSLQWVPHPYPSMSYKPLLQNISLDATRESRWQTTSGLFPEQIIPLINILPKAIQADI